MAVKFEPHSLRQIVLGCRIDRFGFGVRHFSCGLRQAPMVEPVVSFKGGKPYGLVRPPWAAPANDLGLAEVSAKTLS